MGNVWSIYEGEYGQVAADVCNETSIRRMREDAAPMAMLNLSAWRHGAHMLPNGICNERQYRSDESECVRES